MGALPIIWIMGALRIIWIMGALPIIWIMGALPITSELCGLSLPIHLQLQHTRFAYHCNTHALPIHLQLQHTRFAYTLAASTHTLCLYTCSFNTHALPITSELCGLVDIHTAVRPERGIDRWVRETSRVGLRHKQWHSVRLTDMNVRSKRHRQWHLS